MGGSLRPDRRFRTTGQMLPQRLVKFKNAASTTGQMLLQLMVKFENAESTRGQMLHQTKVHLKVVGPAEGMVAWPPNKSESNKMVWPPCYDTCGWVVLQSA